MKEASAEKVKEAFHPNGSVVGHLHGDFSHRNEYG